MLAPGGRKMRMRALVAAMLLAGCSGMQVAVDPRSITDHEKYKGDLAQCQDVAKNYDLTGTTVTTGVVAGVAGGTAVAGIAMAVAGGLFPPAIPFIVAGAVTAGAGGVGWTKSKEKEAREKVLAACLNERGYKAYPPN